MYNRLIWITLPADIILLYMAYPTDSPDCVCGFMSVERMRLLLRLDSVGGSVYTQLRQQITPDIRFTCDGMITKWIVVADWRDDDDDNFYPELQIWRSSGNDTYQKINGTFIEVDNESEDRVYEYDDFAPIPFQAGDILGVFIPRTALSRLRLWSEDTNSPTNYYLTTESFVSESPHDMIDIQNTPMVMSGTYHPLVSVEIGEVYEYRFITMFTN